jgi:hypothetical protein
MSFDDIHLGARECVDKSLRANNLVEEMNDEASNPWCSETGHLEAGRWDSNLVGKSTNTNCQDPLSFVLVCLSATHTDLGMDVML